MRYYAPQLPLTRGSETTYEMLKTMSGVIRQNFRMLILTVPGERIMMPDFGVGLYRFFFEPFNPLLKEKVRTKIQQQVSIYMPFITIKDINFIDNKADPGLKDNTLGVVIKYAVPALNAQDEVQVNVQSYDF
tara:strand:- start:5915 stop:6310 length:396 start_codon:yes stop_codon:yes gene_type:complete